MSLTNFIELYHHNVTVLQTTTGKQSVNHQHIFGGFNLGLHVKDDPVNVHENRAILLVNLQAKYPNIQQIHWLNQVHGNQVDTVDNYLSSILVDADSHITDLSNTALAIMTADCVPIMIASEKGEIIGAVHAGWQGLVKNIIANTVEKMQQKFAKTDGWQAWIGACIAQQHYEIDERVKNAILASVPLESTEIDYIFLPNTNKNGHYFANLAKIAEMQLKHCGIQQVYQSGLDSYGDERFYSYRQQTQQQLANTGRMVTLIFRN